MYKLKKFFLKKGYYFKSFFIDRPYPSAFLHLHKERELDMYEDKRNAS